MRPVRNVSGSSPSYNPATFRFLSTTSLYSSDACFNDSVVGKFDWVEPLEGRTLKRSVIQVEAIDVNSGSHDSHKKSKGHTEEWPLSRQRTVGGYISLTTTTGPTLWQAAKFLEPVLPSHRKKATASNALPVRGYSLSSKLPHSDFQEFGVDVVGKARKIMALHGGGSQLLC